MRIQLSKKENKYGVKQNFDNNSDYKIRNMRYQLTQERMIDAY